VEKEKKRHGLGKFKLGKGKERDRDVLLGKEEEDVGAPPTPTKTYEDTKVAQLFPIFQKAAHDVLF
jgi:hypothetical protein